MKYAFKVFRRKDGKLLSLFDHGKYTLEYFPGKVAKALVGKIFCCYSFPDILKVIEGLKFDTLEIWLVEVKNLEILPFAAKKSNFYERFWQAFDQGERSFHPAFSFSTLSGTLVSPEIKPVKFLLSFDRRDHAEN